MEQPKCSDLILQLGENDPFGFQKRTKVENEAGREFIPLDLALVCYDEANNVVDVLATAQLDTRAGVERVGKDRTAAVLFDIEGNEVGHVAVADYNDKGRVVLGGVVEGERMHRASDFYEIFDTPRGLYRVEGDNEPLSKNGVNRISLLLTDLD